MNLSDFRSNEVVMIAQELRERVFRWTGIPTCVGIGPTKTLAKLGNFLAKKRPEFSSVCDLRAEDVRSTLLATVPVNEVWGIGGTSTAKLGKLGVSTAADLASLEPEQARSLLTVTGGRVLYELRGISCLPLDMLEPTRKGLAVTRSFGHPILDWQSMSEAVATYAARAAEKMRRHEVVAANLFVFMHTSHFSNGPGYSNGAAGRFLEATNDTCEVVTLAKRLAERIWRDGFYYAKAGVLFSELSLETMRQPALWSEIDHEKRAKAWSVMDRLNTEMGADTVRLMSTGAKAASWKLRAGHRSPKWTTCWSELPIVKA